MRPQDARAVSVNEGATSFTLWRTRLFATAGAVLCKDLSTLLSELRITRAYMRLLFAAPDKDGSKTVLLARIAQYEVLLVEFVQPWLADSPRLWLELYAHDIDATIDSCWCEDFDEMVGAAKQLILRAKALNDAHPAASGRNQC